MTNVLLVQNPASGSADQKLIERIKDVLGELGAVKTLDPADSSEHLEEMLPREAGGSDLVVVAGGDGTLNCTVNGLQDYLDWVTFGLIPMGTGNDLARTLGIPEDPVEAAHAVVSGTIHLHDVARASGGDVRRLFVNACMGGFPVQVDEAVDDEAKRRLGPVAFWVGGAKAATDLTRSTVTVNGNAIEDCVAVGVGNGRTCGGGVEVWPNAQPNDGLLDICALPVSDPKSAVKLLAKIKKGKHLEIDGVMSDRAARVVVEAEPAIDVNVDGELVKLRTPAVFEVIGQTRVLVPTK